MHAVYVEICIHSIRLPIYIVFSFLSSHVDLRLCSVVM